MVFGGQTAAREAMKEAALKKARRQGAEEFRKRAVKALRHHVATLDYSAIYTQAFNDAADAIAALPLADDNPPGE